MSKRFITLQALQTWLVSRERGEYEIEYIVKEGPHYVVMLHRARNAA